MRVVRRMAVAMVLVALVTGLTPASGATAAAKSRTHAAIWGPSAGTYGTTVTLGGYLRDATGALMTGATAYVQRSVHGSARYQASTSKTIHPAALRKVVFDSIKTTSWETGALRVTGRVFPAPRSGFPVYLQRWVPSSKSWRSIGLARTTGGSSVAVTSRAAGSVLTYRLYAPFSSSPIPYGAGVSRSVAFQNLVWRGVFRKSLLAKGGTGHPKFTVIPPADAPYRSEAELVADRTGAVWGDLNTSGCARIEAFFGNITDGSVRVSLLRGTSTVGTVTMTRESEADVNRSIGGTPRLRMQVQDLTSATGPQVATDTRVLCNN